MTATASTKPTVFTRHGGNAVARSPTGQTVMSAKSEAAGGGCASSWAPSMPGRAESPRPCRSSSALRPTPFRPRPGRRCVWARAICSPVRWATRRQPPSVSCRRPATGRSSGTRPGPSGSWVIIALRRDSPEIETAEDYYRHAVALAEELGMRPLVGHCHLGLGKLYRRRASASRRRSTSPPRRRCTARWTCGSG